MTDEDLLENLKNYLDITWKDSLGDKKLLGIMQRGMSAIEGKIGKCNFYEETQERALLFDYVMYARAGEIDTFWRNYISEIISLQVDRKVEEFAESQEQL